MTKVRVKVSKVKSALLTFTRTFDFYPVRLLRFGVFINLLLPV
jgi:hypothetical protein